MKRVVHFVARSLALAPGIALAASAVLVLDAPPAAAQGAATAPEISEQGISAKTADTDATAEHAKATEHILVKGKALPPFKAEVAKPQNWLDEYLPYEERVAGWVDNTARSIDRFFGTDDAWRVDNESWLRISNDLRWEQDKGVSDDLRPRLKLDLPTASKRLHLLVETDAPEQRTAAQEAVPGLRSTDQRRTTVFGIGTDFDKWLPQWRKQFQVGLRVALPIDPYVRFIARRDVPLGDKWEFNSYNRLAWFNSDGYSANSELKFGKPLAENWRLYYSTDLSWRENRDYLQFAQSANLANILSSRAAVTYTLGFSGTGLEQPQIDTYFLTADYRRNVARRIVFLDVIPELSLPKDYGFDPHWAITLRLEFYFQKKIEKSD